MSIDQPKERSIDPADIAQDNSEMMLQHSLQHRQPEGPQATGFCLWCDEELSDGVRWCNASCRDDWEVSNAKRHPR